MIRPLIGASLLVLMLASTNAPARAQETWQTYAMTDENGEAAASLVFGIPETDSALLVALCHPGSAGTIDVSLYMGTGQEQPGDDATIVIATPDATETRPAFVDGSFESETGPYFSMPLDRHDSIWQTLMAGSVSTVAANGGAAVAMHLHGSRAAISRFLQSCDAIAGGPSPGAPLAAPLAALVGPLFVVGSAPAAVLSAYQGGVPLPSLAPGTELMATNVTGRIDGADWLEVRTDRGAGPAVWVAHAALVPSSGGATAYQNLNAAANLLLRASAAKGAAVVGTVPPGATGILDQGQRQGNWVLVRYGTTVGWASHDYLLPLLAAETVADTGADTGEDAVPAPGHQAAFGAWTVSCEPCASYEDPMCTATAGALPQTITVVADDNNPTRVGDIRIGMDLPGDTSGTLSILVDGVPVASIPPATLQYMEMTGEFLVDAPYLKGLLGPMSRGSTASVLFVSTSGQTQSFSLPLSGFGDAVKDLVTASPDYPRDAACRE